MFSALGIVMCSRLTFNVAISHPFTYILEEANGKKSRLCIHHIHSKPKKTYKKEKKENLVFLLLPFMVHNEEGCMKQ